MSVPKMHHHVSPSASRSIPDVPRSRFGRILLLFCVLMVVCGLAPAQVYVGGVQTSIAGPWEKPVGIVSDSANNVYVAQCAGSNPVVKKIDPTTHAVSVYISQAAGGFSNCLQYMAVDASNNLYIVDADNKRIVKWSTATNALLASYSAPQGPFGMSLNSAGDIFYSAPGSPVAIAKIPSGSPTGTVGTTVFTDATLTTAVGLAFDASDNMYVSDSTGDALYKYTKSAGTYSTATRTVVLSGVGHPYQVYFDASQNMFVPAADTNTVYEYFAPGYTTASRVQITPGIVGAEGITIDHNKNLFLGAWSGSTVAEIGLAGLSYGQVSVASSSTNQVNFQVTAGTSIASFRYLDTGYTGGEFAADTTTNANACTTGTYATTKACSMLVKFTPDLPGMHYGAVQALNGSGNVLATAYVSGFGVGPVLLFQPGTISTVVGTGVQCNDIGSGCGDGGPATSATLKDVNDQLFDSQHNIYVADIIGNVVRKIDTTGKITTIVGQMNTGCPVATSPCGDGGPGTSALLYGPTKLALDGAGNLYIADKFENRIRVYNLQTGIIKAFAGTGVGTYSGDGGAALSATVTSPDGLAIDPDGNVFIGDTGNQVVRKVTIATGKIETVVTGTKYPNELRPDGKGNIYIANGTGNNVLKLDANYHLTVVAGTGTQCSNPTAACGDGGQATAAQTGTVWSAVLDGAGNIYFTDNTDRRVRFVNATTGVISTLVGNGGTCNPPTGACGDGGVGTSATLYYPTSLAFDVQGNLLIGDDYARKIRKLQFAATSLDFGTLSPGTTGTQTITITNAGNGPLDFPIPATGSDPNIASPYSISSSSTCPIVTSTSTSDGSLPVGASCTYVVSYTPTTSGSTTGGFTLTDNNLGIPGSTQGVSFTGTVTAPVVTQLGFATAPPSTLTAGSSAGTVTVNLEDGTGALASTSTASVTLTVTGPNGYSQTFTSTTVNGVATFNLPAALTAAGGYTYTATSTSLTSAVAQETVTAAAAAKVVVSGGNSTATAGGNAGSVTLTVEDQYGNPVTTSGTALPYSFTDSTGTVIASGTATTTSGVATVNLSGTTLTKSGTDTLSVSGSGLTGATSTVTVSPAPATTVSVTGAPTAPVTASSSLGTLTSTVVDQYGNPIPGNKTLTYTVAGPQPATTTIGTGTGTTSSTTGQATLDLSSLHPTVAGTYVVTVSGPGITPYQTTITVAAQTTNDKLVVAPIPAITAGTSTGPITATLADTYNNTVTTSTAPVVFSITGPAGFTPVTLNSTAVNGVATTNLPSNLTIAGTYTLTATSNGIVTGTQTITVNPGTPSAVTIDGLPSSTSPLAPRSTLGPLSVNIVDQYGNKVTNATTTLTYTLTLPDGTTVTGTATAVNGVITALNPPISLTQVGNYTLSIGGPGITTSISTFSVAQLVPTPVVSVSSSSMPFGTSLGTVLSSSATLGGTTVPGTWSYTATLQPNGPTIAVTAGTVLTGGTYTITGTFTPTDTTVYKTVSASTTLTVTKIAPAITLKTSVNPVLLLNNVVFTATLTNATTVPTGTVTFLDGTTSIGTGVLVNGVATLSTSSLATGTHPITASYGGDTNFTTISSAEVSQVVQDFSLTISSTSSSSTTATVIPGGTATYNLVVAPTVNTTFPTLVNLTVAGAPAGSLVTLTPSSIAAGAGSTPLVLTVVTPAPHAMNTNGTGKGIGGMVSLALLLLPFGRKLRRTSRRFGLLGVILLVLGLGGAFAGLTGCGSATGFLGQAPQTYTLTVTGTSGALTHSTSVTLNVQ